MFAFSTISKKKKFDLLLDMFRCTKNVLYKKKSYIH